MSIRTKNAVSLKRGDSFVFTNNYLTDDTGSQIDLTGWLIRSHVRDSSNELIDTLDIVVSQFEYSITKIDTSLWPIGNLFWDIEYTTPDGIVFSSDTIVIKVIQDVTF